ncbi:MAG TPA: TlpA disulfide reductase family protein, partial [Steroidobacteraceae bacterium]|nr:TlpA disulfide reductase family protein [Steroidobacteraceae bacterium]
GNRSGLFDIRFFDVALMKSLALIALALAAAVAGFVTYRYAVAPPAVTAAAKDSAEPAKTPAHPVTDESVTSTTDADTSIPETLPDFTLMDRDGAMKSIRSWPGKSMIVNFWATWCGPCRREIPFLKELQHERGKDGFQLVGVAVDVREDVLKYADKIGIDYPLLMGEQDAFEAVSKFGLASTGFPFTVFTDKDARIVVTHLGELKPAQAKIILDAVSRVNAGELTPVQARTVVAKQLAAA